MFSGPVDLGRRAPALSIVRVHKRPARVRQQVRDQMLDSGPSARQRLLHGRQCAFGLR